MADLDTLRWGDSQVLVFGPFGAGEHAHPMTTKQLIAAHWRWPVVWGLRVIIRETGMDPAETATINLAVDVVVGSGQSQATARFLYNLVSTAPGVYAPINDLQFIPACDIQAGASILGSQALVVPGVQQNIPVGLFVAPQTELHALTRIYEKMLEQGGGESPRYLGDNPARPFQDDRLHYKER